MQQRTDWQLGPASGQQVYLKGCPYRLGQSLQVDPFEELRSRISSLQKKTKPNAQIQTDLTENWGALKGRKLAKSSALANFSQKI